MTRPSSFLDWATGAGADVEEPTAAKKIAGWSGREIPPARWFNWLFKRVDEWIKWLIDSHVSQEYATVDAWWDDWLDGDAPDRVLIQESDFTLPFFEASTRGNAATDSIAGECCCTDGLYVYWGDEQGIVRAQLRHGSTTPVWTKTFSGGQPVKALATDGKVLIVGGVSGHVKCWHNIHTASPSEVWDYTHGATVHAVAIDGENAIYAGGVTHSSKTLVKLDYTLGTLLDSVDHGVNPWVSCMATDGLFLWYGICNTNTGTVPQVIRAELTDFTTIAAWQGFGEFFQPAGLALTEEFLYVCGGEGATPRGVVALRRDLTTDGNYPYSTEPYWYIEAFAGEGSEGSGAICWTGRYIVVAVADNYGIVVLDPRTGSKICDYDTSHKWYGICTDGFQVYATREDVSGQTSVLKAFELNTPATLVEAQAYTDSAYSTSPGGGHMLFRLLK